MADANRTGVAYVKETVWGVTPATDLKNLNFTGESLGFNISNTTSNNIRSDRQISNLIQNGADASGGFNYELQFGPAMDAFLQAALWSEDWIVVTGDQMRIRNGVIQSSFTFERHHEDVGQFFQFQGMVVNSFTMNVQANSVITGSFDFKGKSATRTDVTAGTGTNTAADTTEPMSAVTNVGNITIDSVPVPSCLIKEISLTVSNSVEGDTGIGVLGYCDVSAGEISVTGTMKLKFIDGTYYDKYLAGTPFALAWTMTDAAGNLYTISLPNCKISTDKINATGKNTKVVEEVSFQAIMDPVGGYTIEVVKDPA